MFIKNKEIHDIPIIEKDEKYLLIHLVILYFILVKFIASKEQHMCHITHVIQNGTT
jgi:hypothetical protein